VLPTAWVSEDAPTTGFSDTVAAIAGGITPFHHIGSRRHRPSGDNTVDEQADRVNRTDAWDSGDAYEPYVGRWSRLVAREFLGWLAMPTGSRWLDVGCGTGALAETILALAAPREVVGVDPSPAYVAFARDRVIDPRVRFEVGDAQAIQEASATFDAVVSGLVLNFVPEPDRALSEMVRVARPDGVVAAYVWDYTEGMQMMRHFWDAAAALDPRATELDEGRRFPLCKPEPLTDLFHTAGLEKVEVRAIDVPTVFREFDDYWSPFLGGQAPAPGYAVSLSEERRAALREQIRASLPTNSRGEHHLIARAWAIRGVR
jgi:SAM-dependent methyltransferase